MISLRLLSEKQNGKLRERFRSVGDASKKVIMKKMKKQIRITEALSHYVS